MQASAFTANAAPVTEAQFQQHALNIHQHVVIEACAGSGKTWLLTARLLRLLAAQVPPHAILAITFTRKATQEMKQRLADMLTLLCDEHHTQRASTMLALGLEDSPALRKQLAHCWNQAFMAGQWPIIATFHEWFSGVRKAAPFSLQSAPAAQLSEDEYAHTQRAWQAFWKMSQQDAELAAHMKTAIAQLGLHGFETALKAVLARRAEWQVYLDHGGQSLSVAQAQAAFEATIQVKPAAQILDDCCAAVQTMRGLPSLFLAVEGKEMNKRGQAIAQALDGFFAYEKNYPLPDGAQQWGHAPISQAQLAAFSPHALALLAALSRADLALPAASRIVFAPMRALVGKREGGEAAFAAAYAHCHAVLTECYAALETLRLLPAHHGVLYCADALIAAYRHDKLAHGVVDFTDLELEALAVLQATQGSPASGDLPWARTQHVLLDEFQDTNPIQWQALQAFLAPLLSEASSGGQAVSIFMVGDPKQSIYRFRRADPALFGHVAQWLHATFCAVVLRTQRTRRNAAQVNALVNRVFVAPELAHTIFAQQFTLSSDAGELRALPLAADSSAALDDGVDDDDANASAPAAPARTNLLTQPLDAHFGAASPFAAEAEQIATTLRTWKSAHPSQPWAQVMVLARRRAPLQAMAAALHAAGVPCVSDEKGGFFQHPEVADVLALLRALNNPLDALATLHALRSPIFGLTNAQLSQLAAHWQAAKAHANPPWCALGSLAQDWARNACAWLKQWQWLARHLPTHDALDAMLKQGQMQANFCAAAPAQRTPWIVANMQQLLRTALDVDGGRYPSLAKFMAHVQALSESNSLAAEPLAAPDAVRLSTIHSAKGLEAELVILMDTCSRAKHDDAIHVLLDWPATQAAPTYFGVALGRPWAGLAAAQAAAQNKAAHALEQHTLLYVALTRAKNALWLSGTPGKNKITVYAQVQAAIAALTPTPAASTAPSTAASTAASSEPSGVQPSSTSALTQRQSPRAARAAGADLLRLAPQSTPCVPPYVEPLATQRGKALHSALQGYMQHGVLPCAATLLTRGTLPLAQVNDALQDAGRMVQSLQLAALRAHPLVQRLAIEQAWLQPQSEGLAQLVRPDLVVYGEQFCWLVDYKTQFNPSHESAQAYAAQLRTYLTLLPLNAQAYLLTSASQCWAFDPMNAHAPWQTVPVPWG